MACDNYYTSAFFGYTIQLHINYIYVRAYCIILVMNVQSTGRSRAKSVGDKIIKLGNK